MPWALEIHYHNHVHAKKYTEKVPHSFHKAANASAQQVLILQITHLLATAPSVSNACRIRKPVQVGFDRNTCRHERQSTADALYCYLSCLDNVTASSLVGCSAFRTLITFLNPLLLAGRSAASGRRALVLAYRCCIPP
jgi:hypothetical protein